MSWKAGLIGGAAVAVAAASGGAVLLAANDGDRSVAPVVIPNVSVVPASVPAVETPPVSVVPQLPPVTVTPQLPPVTAVSPPVTVAVGVAERVGVLSMRGDEFMLDGVEVDIGPDWWAASTLAGADLDGDGVVATWWQEMTGLLGRSITVLGEVDDGDIDAFEVNGVPVRALDAASPPWSGGGRDDDWTDERREPELPVGGVTMEQATAIALAQIPGVVTDARLDVDDGLTIWDFEIRSVDGAEYDVEIDALSGQVLEVYRD